MQQDWEPVIIRKTTTKTITNNNDSNLRISSLIDVDIGKNICLL